MEVMRIGTELMEWQAFASTWTVVLVGAAMGAVVALIGQGE